VRQSFNVLAGAATVHDGAFLLLRRSARESFLPNVWGIPAGQVHFDEDVAEASLRELSEETGLRGKIVSILGYSRFRSERESVQLANIQLNFLVIAPASSVRLDPASHSEHRWIPLDDPKNPLLDNFTRPIFVEASMCYKDYY
jgi:8-oxo-dGTP diphosphatase